MNEIDWSKALEGATHYNDVLFDWYKVTQIGAVFFWNSRTSEWRPAWFWDDYKHDCIQRPTTPSWSGEGMPPVGADIEVKHELYGWIGARVVGQDGEAAIVRTNGGYAGVFPHQMRQIRTPEQIAADEREKGIAALLAAAGVTGSAFADDPEAIEWAAALYDAGYRKP